MACIESPSANVDSEMEEGEIVDGADDLSDISSEEEFLLRQRLQVLENYNNVLERKEAKRTSIGSGTQHRRVEALYDFSDISGADADNGFSKLTLRVTREQKLKPQQKQKKYKQHDKEFSRIKEHKEHRKKNRSKKKVTVISDSETSEISDDEYRNKRRRLENAVSLFKSKNDTTTLKDRLTKMLCGSKIESPHIVVHEISETVELPDKGQPNLPTTKEQSHIIAEEKLLSNSSDQLNIDADDGTTNKSNKISVESEIIEKKEESNCEGNSDDDLELLRQLALKTKSVKYNLKMPNQQVAVDNKPVILSDDEDSDTAELRMICLKSAFLKKAIEIKQKQKLIKRFSQSSISPDDFDIQKADNDINMDNNTDIESVDMDIGSDAEDKGKIINDCVNVDEVNIIANDKDITKVNFLKDELEDDEDLLRAKLLTSLSKNLPNLVELKVFDSVLPNPEIKPENNVTSVVANVPEENKFIIELGESDSEGENEATKNLTKMHIKLSEQQEFQNKLDLFLKSTRMEVEKKKLPDVVQHPLQKPPEKFVAKVMNHLPKSEQIEYKNLVKRMAELEKMKQARQNAVSNKLSLTKETLKPKNISMDATTKTLDVKIALSRKKIAQESEKMLKLKEEAKKLSQRYKIAATELRNITTAITLNKKHQRVVQSSLSKIRHQHQMLLKSSPSIHSISQTILSRQPDKMFTTTKLQKENDPSTEEHKNPNILKSVKINIVNNLNSDNVNISHPRLSVQLDVSNNKKVVTLPKSPLKDRTVEFKKLIPKKDNEEVQKDVVIDKADIQNEINNEPSKSKDENEQKKSDLNEYKSPLDSLRCKSWEEDPNGVLCPYEVGGSCRDPDCKYLHPKIHKTE